jgi:hypothetical protein
MKIVSRELLYRLSGGCCASTGDVAVVLTSRLHTDIGDLGKQGFMITITMMARLVAKYVKS